jgi:hypothetical protein
LVPIEIKSGKTRNSSYFSNLQYWQQLTDEVADNLTVVYGGDDDLKTQLGNYVGWRNTDAILK